MPRIFLRSSSYVPSLFLRTKVGAKSVQSRWGMGVSSSLVRRKSEGLWEDEQTMKYSKSSFNVNLENIKIPTQPRMRLDCVGFFV